MRFKKKKKNTLEGANSRITETEDRISEVEDRMVEKMKQKKKKKKKELKEMRTTSETSGTLKHHNIRIIGVPKEDKKKDQEKILEQIIVENFPKMGKEIVT